MNDTELSNRAILGTHELSKAFVSYVYKTATGPVVAKVMRRRKGDKSYEYTKSQLYNDMISKETSIEYILDKDSAFESWCDASKDNRDTTYLSYSDIVSEVEKCTRLTLGEKNTCCNYIFVELFTRVHSRKPLNQWSTESKRLGAAISMLHGRYNIKRHVDEYMSFFEDSPMCDIRSDMPYILTHTTIDPKLIQVASDRSYELLRLFSMR